MRKSIVVLSDGTGNAASAIWRTNVWRLFQSLDLTKSDQIAIYDDGVGTSAFKPLALLGGAFGWGLKRNVLELYKFVCRNYEADYQIFGFGFSRGAFTIRVVMGLIVNQGIVRFSSDAELDKNAKAAYRAYRRARYHTYLRIEKPFRIIRDVAVNIKNWVLRKRQYSSANNIKVSTIRFIGAWDTVAAYGLPIEEMTRGVSQWLWPLELPDRELSPKVIRACHALALDDERTTFHPVLWDESNENAPSQRDDGSRYIQDERLSQVWFPGVHSNVGGGYADDSLAYIALHWIMREAQTCGLRFKSWPQADPDAEINIRASRDKDGRLYDSRAGLAGYYRYGPRKIDLLSHAPKDGVEIPLPKIHQCVFARTLEGAHIYTPIGLPQKYTPVRDDGRILAGSENPYESPDRAVARASTQESVWDLVWQRRIIYFATLGATFHLFLFPLIYSTDRADEFSTRLRPVSETIRIIDAFSPNFFNLWLNAYAAKPGRCLLSILAVALLIGLGLHLRSRIIERMRAIWRAAEDQLPGLPTSWIYKLRTSKPYQTFHSALKRHLLPFLSALGLVYISLTLASHVLFNFQDASGLSCQETTYPKGATWLGETLVEKQFSANEMCWPSGIQLAKGQRYQIILTMLPNEPFRDGNILADLSGYELTQLPDLRDRLSKFLSIPLRRVFLRPWFRIIGRIGETGTDEYFFDPDRPTGVGLARLGELSIAFRARRSGELFIYVNEAVIGFPGLSDLFYRNNTGKAKLLIKHLPR
jgi:uncharacterized protein (DUF2235 family)